MKTKEYLFDLRNELRETIRKADNEEQKKDLMILMNEITNSINKINEEDLRENIKETEEVKAKIENSKKNINEATKELNDKHEKFKNISIVIDSTRDIISQVIKII